MIIISSQWRGFYSATDVIYTHILLKFFSISACQHKTDEIPRQLSQQATGREQSIFHTQHSYSSSVNLDEFLYLCPLHNARLHIFQYLCLQVGLHRVKTREYLPIGHRPHTLLRRQCKPSVPFNCKILDFSRNAAHHSTPHLGEYKHYKTSQLVSGK